MPSLYILSVFGFISTICVYVCILSRVFYSMKMKTVLYFSFVFFGSDVYCIRLLLSCSVRVYVCVCVLPLALDTRERSREARICIHIHLESSTTQGMCINI